MQRGLTTAPVQKTWFEYLPPPITDGVAGTDSVAYVGYSNFGTATSEAGWLIIRYTKSGSVVTPEYADGSNDFNQVWDDRASITNWSR